jgi:hypothetical protein
MISGMLMRSAAEKFWMLISIWRSGSFSNSSSLSARLCTLPGSKKLMASPSSSAS